MSISWILQHFGLKIAFAMLRLRNLRIPDRDDDDHHHHNFDIKFLEKKIYQK